MSVVFAKTVTESDVHLFAGLTGDFYGVHTDESFAAVTRFGGRIAHGAYLVALLGAAVGRMDDTLWPAAYDVRFVGPVHLGETVRVALEPLGQGLFRGSCLNSRDQVVLDGTVGCRRLAGGWEPQLPAREGGAQRAPSRTVDEARLARLGSIAVGDGITLRRTLGEADLVLFLAIGAETHPIHIDRQAARDLGVPWRVAPTAYAVGLVSAAMGRMAARVPAPGAVSYRYRLVGRGWFCAGETVTTTLTAREVLHERYEVLFDTACFREDGEPLVAGTTVLKVV